MSGAKPESLIVPMANGLQLVVVQERGYCTLSTWLGEYPCGQRLTFSIGDDRGRLRVDVPERGDPCLWCGTTSFNLPWLELLKVADFLHLEVPLAQPAGSQVPA